MPKPALQYLREQLGGDFLNEYKVLAEPDKTRLKEMANEEMAVMGISE